MFLAAISILIACVFVNWNLSSEPLNATTKNVIPECKLTVVCNDSNQLDFSVPLKGNPPGAFSIPPMECIIVEKEIICLGLHNSKYTNKEWMKEYGIVQRAVHDEHLLRQGEDVAPPGYLVPDQQEQKKHIKSGGVRIITPKIEVKDQEAIDRDELTTIALEILEKHVATTTRYILFVASLLILINTLLLCIWGDS